MTRRFSAALVAALVLGALLLFGSPASAKSGNGMVQLSATGDPFAELDCSDDVGRVPDLILPIVPSGEGWSLGGCLYQFFGPARTTPAGNLNETGEEIFVGYLYRDGHVVGHGTFETTYRFTGKFEDLGDPLSEIFGRCQHPIVDGSGTGVFEGVSGRLDFKDVLVRDDSGELVDAYFPLRGHLRL